MQPFCRRWKWHRQAKSKDDRPKLVLNRRMHHRTVSVFFDMLFEALVGVTPGDVARLFALHAPIAEALEACLELQSPSAVHEIDEAIANARPSLEVNWDIDQIVAAFEAFLVKQP